MADGDESARRVEERVGEVECILSGDAEHALLAFALDACSSSRPPRDVLRHVGITPPADRPLCRGRRTCRPPAGRLAALGPDLFCRNARRAVARRFRALLRNDDDHKSRVAARVMEGHHRWLEAGILDLWLPPDAFATPSLLAAGDRPAARAPGAAVSGR